MEKIEKFRIIANQYNMPKAYILEYFNFGDRLNTESFEQKERTVVEFLKFLGSYTFNEEQLHFLKTKDVIQKLKVSISNYDNFTSNEEIFDKDFLSDTYSEEKLKEDTKRVLNQQKKSQRKTFITVFITVFLITFFLIWFFKSNKDEIKGESSDSYIVMDSKCGCDSPNGEAKREAIFQNEYKNKWVTYIGTISSISDNKLMINADLKGVSDLSVEFENSNDIYDLKVGSFVAVKFVLREQGGCFSDYQGDLGKVISNDMIEIQKMMH